MDQDSSHGNELTHRITGLAMRMHRHRRSGVLSTTDAKVDAPAIAHC